MVRSSNPAETSSTRDNAISLTIKALRSRACLAPVPAAFDPSCNASCGSAEAASNAGATPKITVAATHGPLVAEAADRIAALGVRNILVTDTLPGADSALVHHCSVADLLADAIRRLAEHRPLDELLLRT